MRSCAPTPTRTIKITVPGPFTMAQQAQNDAYASEAELALDYAAAVNEEIKDLFAAGADIVQVDEPYLQARPAKAREYGLQALNRALEGITQPTAVHLCFGYAAIIHERPSGYSFLGELADSPVQQISIETAQSSLDCSVLEQLRGKTIILGVLDLSTPEIESARDRGGAYSARAAVRRTREDRRRAGLRSEVPAARRGAGEDAGDGGGREDRPRRTRVGRGDVGSAFRRTIRQVRLPPSSRASPGRTMSRSAKWELKLQSTLCSGDIMRPGAAVGLSRIAGPR